jgi:hypothetical protein
VFLGFGCDADRSAGDPRRIEGQSVTAGKRIPAGQFLQRASGIGFAFCEAALGWNSDGTVIDSLKLTNWDGGYPDVYAVPDFSGSSGLAGAQLSGAGWRSP